jgi:large subunit ribosomal protein L17
MRHRIQQRKLGVVSKHRQSMLRNMTTSLLREERIVTTLPRAKELRRVAERMITLGKREDLHARRQAAAYVRDRMVVRSLFDTLSSRYAGRSGGYTRIVRLGPRKGDGAEMALIELVDTKKPVRREKTDAKAKAKGKAEAAAAGGEAPAATGRARKLMDKLKGGLKRGAAGAAAPKPDKVRKQQTPQDDDAK